MLSSNRQEEYESSGLILWIFIFAVLIMFSLTMYGAYRIGMHKQKAIMQSADMQELVTLRQVMQNYPNSIVVVDCKQFKMSAHKLRKRDTIYGECK